MKFSANKYIIVFIIVTVLYAFWVIINREPINVVLLIIAAIALMYCLKTVVINESGVTSTWLNIFNNTLTWDTIDNIHIEQTLYGIPLYGRLEIPLICVIPIKNTNKRRIKMTFSKEHGMKYSNGLIATSGHKPLRKIEGNPTRFPWRSKRTLTVFRLAFVK